MEWVKLYTNWWEHERTLDLPLASRGLWVTALAWVGAHRVDGFISVARVGWLIPVGEGGDPIGPLVTAGLWEAVEGGYRFHDFEHYQAEAIEIQQRLSVAQESGRLGGLRSAEVRNAKYGTAQPNSIPKGGSEGGFEEGFEGSPKREKRIEIENIYTPPKGSPPISQPVEGVSLVVRPEPSAEPKPDAMAQCRPIFEAWKARGNLNGRTVFTQDRQRKVKARLREYPFEDVLGGAVGIWASPWHVERGQTDLALALRDGAHLERFRDLAAAAHAEPSGGSYAGIEFTVEQKAEFDRVLAGEIPMPAENPKYPSALEVYRQEKGLG